LNRPGRDAGAVRDRLSEYRNDLEPAAISLCKEIGRALALIEVQPGCLLARMSGSGATCFGLFEDEASSQAAAIAIADAKKKYWVRATSFRGAPPVPLDDARAWMSSCIC